MEDSEYLAVLGMCAALAVALILHARVLRAHDELLVRHDEDITFLRLVTREMEGKLND